MKKLLLIVIAFVIFASGWIASYQFRDPEVVTITQDKIITQVIEKDVSQMSINELQSALDCFYKDLPVLSVNHMSGDEYLLSAALCERKWHRNVEIKVRSPAYRNIAAAGLFLDSELRTGFYSNYYRLFGRFGFGGGIEFTSGYGQVKVGGVWLW